MFMLMGLFGAIFLEVFDVLLVSSLSIRGSGMLHGLINFTMKLNVNDKQRGALRKLQHFVGNRMSRDIMSTAVCIHPSVE